MQKETKQTTTTKKKETTKKLKQTKARQNNYNEKKCVSFKLSHTLTNIQPKVLFTHLRFLQNFLFSYILIDEKQTFCLAFPLNCSAPK